MKAQQAIFVCVAVFCCSWAHADPGQIYDFNNDLRGGQQTGVQETQSAQKSNINWNPFLLGTIGVHTRGGNAFGGLTAYIGGYGKRQGFGILGSYEIGRTTELGIDLTGHIGNVSVAFSYKIGKSTVLLAGGITAGYVTADDFDIGVARSGVSSSITYLYQPDNVFTFMIQGRRQGQGLMFSAGVGF